MNAKEHFSKIKTNLEILRKLNVDVPVGDYVCPLCLTSFSKTDYNLLSEEDVPQESLGGKRITLTCKICNNNCGSQIDVHLLELLMAHEQQKFLPDTNRNIFVLADDKKLNAQLKIDESGDILLVVDPKRNDPKVWDGFRKNELVQDSVVNVQDVPLRHKQERIDAAIIKNAYLLLFAKTGFSILCHEYYDNFRNHIMYPDDSSLPIRLWSIQNVGCVDGIFQYENNELKGFFVVFTLTLQQSYKYFVFIPVPNTDNEDIKKVLYSIGPGKRFTFKRLDESKDYITDETAIKELRKWCEISE